MKRKNDYFQTFCKVSHAFGTTMNKKELLDLIVQSAIKTMDGKAAALFLYEKGKDVFVPVAQRGLSENYLHQGPTQAKKVVAGMLKEGYLAIRDATSDPRVENYKEKKAEGIASLLVVPVVVRDETIGVLTLYTAVPRDFSKEEIEFLNALADQGGIAVQHAELLEQLRRNAMLFLDLTSHINSSLDIKQILGNLTKDICRALEMKGAAIRLLDKDTGDLKLVASYGLSEQFLNKGPVSSTKSSIQAIKGKTVLIKDATKDRRIQYKKAMKAEGIVSMIIAPIKSRDEVIGVMRLYSNIERNFPEDEITLINALAHMGGLAIENASCYLTLQEDMKDLKEDLWSHRSWF